jgi:sugar lactone lactonase YvrE
VCDAHVLADQQSAPIVLALHSGDLYWGNDVGMNVMTMPANASVAARVLFAGRTAVRGFGFDASRVYLTRNVFNIVESASLDGKSSGNYTNQQERGAAGIATDASRAYWADGGFGTIRSAALGAPVQAPTTLASNQTAPDAVALDADRVYWTTHSASGQILALAKTAAAGTAPSVLASDQVNPHSLAVDDGFVYWANQGDGSAGTGSIRRVAVTGGAITTLADQQPGPVFLAVGGGFVYWTDSVAGTVMRVAVDGSAPPSVVVRGEASPSGLAIDNACVYFTDIADGKAGTGSLRSHDLQ